MKDFNFKKSLGQNFLIDNNIKKKIIESADIDKDSLIIEVGAGEGALTKLLVNFNVPVISFEIDTRSRDTQKDILDFINFISRYEKVKVIICSRTFKKYNLINKSGFPSS